MRREIRPWLLMIATAAVLLWLFNYFAPLQLTSVVVYAGLVVTLAGLASVAVPLRFFAIRTRRVGGLVAAAGVVVAVVGLEWPAHSTRIVHPRCVLDEVLPEFDFAERHEVWVRAPAARAASALRQVTFADLKVYSVLMSLRALAGGRSPRGASPRAEPLLPALTKPGSGFLALHDDGRELVGGMAGRPWSNERGPRLQTPEQYHAFREAGSVKVAFNFLVEDVGGGRSRMVTETRIAATDQHARRIMARYWRLIYPGSGMIRRMMLNAVRERAERS